MHPEDDWSLSILVEISLRIWVLCLLMGRCLRIVMVSKWALLPYDVANRDLLPIPRWLAPQFW